jgi:hypothetical protein
MTVAHSVTLGRFWHAAMKYIAVFATSVAEHSGLFHLAVTPAQFNSDGEPTSNAILRIASNTTIARVTRQGEKVLFDALALAK